MIISTTCNSEIKESSNLKWIKKNNITETSIDNNTIVYYHIKEIYARGTLRSIKISQLAKIPVIYCD